MKVYYPSYYKEFKCIAEKCRHSCCVGWEIFVDDETLEKYKSLPDGNEILCHINDGEINLSESRRCPFLRQDGLCRIIAEHGEGFVSVICREHPRFYHRVCGRVEGGLGASCEEVARIILSSDSYSEFYASEWQGDIADETDFDCLSHRENIYSLLKNNSLGYPEKLDKIRATYNLSNNMYSADEWNRVLSELEYLDENHREMLCIGKTCRSEKGHRILERFLAYLLFRHLSVAESEHNLRARLGFCLLLTGILENYMANEEDFSAVTDFARIISEEIEYSEDNTQSLIFEFEISD